MSSGISNGDYSPLSQACVRALQDKIYDKRKTAALEIEIMVKEANNRNNTQLIKRLIRVLSDLVNSQNVNAKKGGLIGLAAIAIGLSKEAASQYTEELIKPILNCFIDNDVRVRFCACESLYNVIKVVREAILPYFSDVFKSLNKLATDPDQSVKNGSELLDRLMKDIVTETPAFDLKGFIPLLRESIYTKNSFARQFVISWVSVLDAVPDIDLIVFLPDILDGLFKILEDSMLEIKKTCETVLDEFLRSIKNECSRVDFQSMINILIVHAQSNDELVQFTAITWIKEFVQLSCYTMLPYLSGILTAILPCLAYDNQSKRNIKDTATVVNLSVLKLITNDQESGNKELSENYSKLDLSAIVEVLTENLAHNSIQTKVAALKWINHLYINIPQQMLVHIDNLFGALLKTLSDPSDEVVQQSLIVLSQLISNTNSLSNRIDEKTTTLTTISSTYYSKFVVSLLKLFRMDKNFLEERGSFIIRQLCVLLSAEEIYKTLAKILIDETNIKFSSTVVKTLNMILLTSPELFELRMKLKHLNNHDSIELFQCLYMSWCHNPVSTISLCLLSQQYKHASKIIKLFKSANLEITLELLMEVDKLVQLIESPIFAYLRLELLSTPSNDDLYLTLYGLLMLLPQSEAFHTLNNRLASIPKQQNIFVYNENLVNSKVDGDTSYICKKMPNMNLDNRNELVNEKLNYDDLLKHFVDAQEKYKASNKSNKIKKISDTALPS